MGKMCGGLGACYGCLPARGPGFADTSPADASRGKGWVVSLRLLIVLLMSAPPPFKLSSTLAGHSADVRSLAASPDGPVLFSSSRDGTARSWYQGEMDQDGKGGGGWTEGLSFGGQHDGFVNAVEWIKGDGQGQSNNEPAPTQPGAAFQPRGALARGVLSLAHALT